MVFSIRKKESLVAWKTEILILWIQRLQELFYIFLYFTLLKTENKGIIKVLIFT
jgi:hypothetical protein